MRTLLAIILLLSAAPAQAGTVVVETDRGAVSVPADPKRVVASYSTDLDYALVLGLPVVGGGPLRGEAGYDFAAHQKAYDLSGVAKVAIFPQINFERLVALQPDVIIANYTLEPNGHDLLSAIAPTLWLDPDLNGGWRGLLRAYARPFGRTDEAEAFIARYEERAAAVRAKMPAGARVALVNNLGNGTFVLMQADHLDVLYRDLGLVPSSQVPATFAARQAFSEERIDLLADADALLLWRNATPDGGRDMAAYERMAGVPGWEDLPAVKTGRVFDFPAELFYTSPLTDLALVELMAGLLGTP